LTESTPLETTSLLTVDGLTLPPKPETSDANVPTVTFMERLKNFLTPSASLVLRAEIERLRAENRHLLNLLLKQNGMAAVGERMPDVHNNPKITMRQRASQMEANAWREWNESVGIAVTQNKA